MNTEISLFWEELPGLPEEVDELAVIVPSLTARNYVKEHGYAFSDPARALLLYWSDRPVYLRYRLLARLRDSTSDRSLRRDLTSFLKKELIQLKDFVANTTNEYAYIVNTSGMHEESGQYFFRFGKAYIWGKSIYKGEEFTIEKIRPLYPGQENADTSTGIFDGAGNLIRCSQLLPERAGTGEGAHPRFARKYYDLPSPFLPGDIVMRVVPEAYGIIESGPTRPDLCGESVPCPVVKVNWLVNNASTAEKAEGFGTSSWCSPFELERYEFSKNEPGHDLLDAALAAARNLCLGRGSIETFSESISRLGGNEQKEEILRHDPAD